MVWVDKDKEDTAWVVGKVKMKVKVEVLGEKELPDWAIALKRYLEGRINSSGEYEGLRDLVRAWVLSERVVCSDLEIELWPVAWSKLDILDEYKRLFASDAFVGGIKFGNPKKKIEEDVKGKKKFSVVKNYYRLAGYKVNIPREGWENSSQVNIEIRRKLDGKGKNCSAELVKEFEGFPEDFLEKTVKIILKENVGTTLIKELKKLNKISKLRLFKFPAQIEGEVYHDIEGMCMLNHDKKIGGIFLSDDLFNEEGKEELLKNEGKYVFLYMMVRLLLVSGPYDIVREEEKGKFRGIVLVNRNTREKIELLKKEELPSENKDEVIGWFYGSLFESYLSKQESFDTKIEREVSRFILTMVAKSGANLKEFFEWIRFGHKILLSRLEKLKGDAWLIEVDKKLREANCPTYGRINILRELASQHFSDEQKKMLPEVILNLYDKCGPHTIFKNVRENSTEWKKVNKIFWRRMGSVVIYFRGLLKGGKEEEYKRFLDLMKNFLVLYKEKKGDSLWFSKKLFKFDKVGIFYSILADLLKSPVAVITFSKLNEFAIEEKMKEKKELLVFPLDFLRQFRDFYVRFLANACFTEPHDSLEEYEPSTGKITLNLEGNVSLSFATEKLKTLNRPELESLLEEKIVKSPLKERLKEFIDEKNISLEVRTFDFMPYGTPLYLSCRGKNVLFIPRGILYSPTAQELDLENELIILALLDLAFQKGMSTEDLIEQDRTMMEALLWRYGYYELLKKEKRTQGISWFFWIYNMRKRNGEEYINNVMRELLFYQGRIGEFPPEEREIWMQNFIKKEKEDGRESLFTKELLPNLIGKKSLVIASHKRYGVDQARHLLTQFLNHQGKIYDVLIKRAWFSNVYLPSVRKLLDSKEKVKSAKNDRLIFALFVALADAVWLEEDILGKEIVTSIVSSAKEIASLPSKVDWNLVIWLRNEIIKAMKEQGEQEQNAKGGILL